MGFILLHYGCKKLVTNKSLKFYFIFLSYLYTQLKYPMQEDNFDLIRPYTDQEVKDAIPRIVKDAAYKPMMDFLFSEEKQKKITKNLLNVKTIDEFQQEFTLPCISSVVEKTSTSATYSGLDNLSRSHKHMFIGNHRDIALDSSLLGLHMINNGITPPAMNWGSNLEVSQFIVDLGKCNQMITVFRDGSPKEILRNSQRLSAFINKFISSNKKSVWIAQSKGRTKDGYDRVEASILKMLILSGDKNTKKACLDLNIIPITISYELEPCGGMKVREVFLSQEEKYKKDPHEDFKSIIGGFTMQKGNIHVEFGKPINDKIDEVNENQTNNGIVRDVAAIIEREGHKNYKLWPTNYLAYDLLENSSRFEEHYNNETKEVLENRCQMVFEVIKDDKEKLRKLFYKMYANPVYIKISEGFL